MSAAREKILARVRGALRDVPSGERAEEVLVAREYRRSDERSREQLLERLAERLRDYHADVRLLGREYVGREIAEECERLGLRRLVVPRASPEAWRPAELEVVEDHGLTAGELDALDGVITGCALAIADTGTLVLDGKNLCGRRVITLLPDHHICVVDGEQVVGGVPEAIVELGAAARQGAPMTLISGPSASSDIELSRVEGVHGPRHLLVLIVS